MLGERDLLKTEWKRREGLTLCWVRHHGESIKNPMTMRVSNPWIKIGSTLIFRVWTVREKNVREGSSLLHRWRRKKGISSSCDRSHSRGRRRLINPRWAQKKKSVQNKQKGERHRENEKLRGYVLWEGVGKSPRSRDRLLEGNDSEGDKEEKMEEMKDWDAKHLRTRKRKQQPEGREI